MFLTHDKKIMFLLQYKLIYGYLLLSIHTWNNNELIINISQLLNDKFLPEIWEFVKASLKEISKFIVNPSVYVCLRIIKRDVDFPKKIGLLGME